LNAATTFQVYKGNQILPIGTPVIIVALDRRKEEYGAIEFYLLVIKPQTGIHYVWQRFHFDGIPRFVMSDDLLLSQALEASEATLQQYLESTRKELGLFAPAPDRVFTMQEVQPEAFLYYVVRHQLLDIARGIRNRTQCVELEKFLDVLRHLQQSSITVAESDDEG